jgi:hypothetical protein
VAIGNFEGQVLSIDTNQKDGFSFTCYTGDGAVLLAFNLDEAKIDKLAGFAVKCKAPHTETYKTDEYWVKNRLNFGKPLTARKKLTPEKWTASNEAPFQAFHWAHFPNAGPGKYTYTIYPVYFDGADLKLAAGLSISVDLTYRVLPDFELGFTRDTYQAKPTQTSLETPLFNQMRKIEQWISPRTNIRSSMSG